MASMGSKELLQTQNLIKEKFNQCQNEDNKVSSNVETIIKKKLNEFPKLKFKKGP